MRTVYLITAFAAVLVVSVLGLRGRTFTQPPMDVFPEWAFPGMKYQPKLTQQAASAFFADGRSDRAAPPGTVAASYGPAGQPLRSDDFLYLGKAPDGSWARGFPPSVKVDMKLLERGRDRFTIYCSPCHGAVGDGNGVTQASTAWAPPPSYHDDRLRKMAEGEIFNTITNGKGQMNPYADKLAPADRWAVIAYVRALQRAQTGTVGGRARGPQGGARDPMNAARAQQRHFGSGSPAPRRRRSGIARLGRARRRDLVARRDRLLDGHGDRDAHDDPHLARLRRVVADRAPPAVRARPGRVPVAGAPLPARSSSPPTSGSRTSSGPG